MTSIVSEYEFNQFSSCNPSLDLDCNNSTGATGADFNSPEFDCLSNGVPIADEDVKLHNDAAITSMTIRVEGFMPNGPNEIVDIMGSVAGINVAGAGTSMITLANAGSAKSTDFIDALHLIVYKNTALYPIGGLRTIEVQFATTSGAQSNIATAFIEVIELPLVPLDLGPDQQRCQGQTATFNAGNPGGGATYQWSNGPTSQSITVGTEGEYIVTVSNNSHCPNQDTVFLDIIPIITVALTGDEGICDNEQANIVIQTNASFSLTVDISTEPGSPFSFSDVMGNYTFADLPSQQTIYTITGVTPSEDACIEITDPVHGIDVYLTYAHEVEASICDGDSVWLGYYWEMEAGVYENTFNSFDGCDSVVTTTVVVLPAIQISHQSTTCDSALAGVFVEYLNNPSGCDTVVTTTVALILSDTTHLSLSTCRSVDVGIVENLLSNQQGCDSLVITTTHLIPPSDTTFVFGSTCDSSLLGVFPSLLTAQDGCDSLVISTVTLMPSDTTHLYSSSCDPGNIGVFQTLYSNQQGCDSLVISTVVAGVPDTTYLQATSCDSASLGIIEEHFVSTTGCDSVVFTTVTYSENDLTFITGSSCSEADTGVFVQTFINRFGCDSIVTLTVTLLPTDQTFLSTTTCDPENAGVFVQTLINRFGCDSVVTETVTLLPTSETFLFSTTCTSSEAGVFITGLVNQYGCDSLVTLTVSLIPADSTVFTKQTCDLSEVGSIETSFTNINGCDSLVIEQTVLNPLPEISVVVTSDYNGHDISCDGATDGSAAVAVNGVPPFTYLWSTGDTDQSITSLAAGTYTVAITDGNGCTAEGTVMLFDPGAFSVSFAISHPDCFGNEKGSISIMQTGGVEPVRYSIDEVNYQSSPVFNHLTGGTYTITAVDANDCEIKEILWINVPLMVEVDLGDDMILTPGDSATVNAIVNVPFDSLASVTWTGLINPNCENCLTQIVAPVITTTYSVTVTTQDGCSDEDAMTLFVDRDNDIYVPNIFSPNGDGMNDELIVYGGDGVKQISKFLVFDRWGNMLFERNDFQPNDHSHSWDGMMKGKAVDPGVFAYLLIVEFKDGTSEARYGDVTLVR